MKKDLILSFVVLFQLIVTTFQLLLPLYGFVEIEKASTLRILVTLATFIPATYIILTRRSKLLFCSVVFYSFVLFFNYALFPDSHNFIESSRAYTLTPISILTILAVICVKDFDNFFKVLLPISRICPIVGLLYVYGTANIHILDEDFTYSMSFGYSFLLPTLFLFHQDNWIDKTLSIVLFLLIVVDGSRGPVVVTMAFICYDLLIGSKVKMKLKSILVLLLIGTAGVAYLANTSFFESSRTVTLARNGELITHDSGREEILYAPALKKIEESPIIGYGLGADRELVGFYVHNVFLEVFLHYGIFGGGVLFLIFFVYCIKLFFNKRKMDYQGGRTIYIMIFMFGFLPLLVSSSYLISFNFAVLGGYLLRFKFVNVKSKKSIYSKNFQVQLR